MSEIPQDWNWARREDEKRSQTERAFVQVRDERDSMAVEIARLTRERDAAIDAHRTAAAEVERLRQSHAALVAALDLLKVREYHVLPPPFGHDCQWCHKCWDRASEIRDAALAAARSADPAPQPCAKCERPDAAQEVQG